MAEGGSSGGGGTAGGGEGEGTTKKKKKSAAPSAPTPGSPKALEASRLRGATPLTGSEQRAGVKRVPGATFAERSQFSESGLPPQQREALPGPNPDLQFTPEALQKTGKYTPEAISELFETVGRVAPDIVGTRFNPNPEVSGELTEQAMARSGGTLEEERGLLDLFVNPRAEWLNPISNPEDRGEFGVRLATGAVDTAAAFTAAGVIAKGAKLGTRLLGTRGLSSAAVSKTATGLLPSQQIALHRAGTAALNTKNAARTVGLLTRITRGSKFASYVVGALSTVAGLTAWGEWGRSEGLESMSFTYRKAKNMGNEQLANDISEAVAEATDKETIDYIIRVTPFANVIAGTRLKNAGSKFAQMQSDFEAEKRKLEGGEESKGLSPSQL